jgi:hypothetical protein
MIRPAARCHNFSGKHFHFGAKSRNEVDDQQLGFFQALFPIIAVSEMYSLEKGENV